ncbi:cyclic nucleotide-binding domain-containing protein [Methylorubrum extorquens]|uniref:cyclic nucleotide-binding domain-containing protein n=1 Tax=Methylorubrum extorquens TaxID=408 RepID=UPI0020A1C081|nr:cyclic nucleotide-binding domain-containing protein [Methylorubrum extorquens]MCP1535648.1 CRP-like cAMP-binding protein [Methylorubrum extorquens]
MTRSPLRSLDGNLLLEALDGADRALLAPYAERREVGRGDVLFRAGDDVSHVTFPAQGCVMTLVVPLRDGKSVETATVGREGAIGSAVSQGYLPAFGQAVVQVAGPVKAA